jgi:hypothetical protein
VPTFQELLDRYAFQAYEKQSRLSSLIGDHDWQLDVDRAQVTFNRKLVFAVQLLGTESSLSNTWRWADANPKSGFPGRSLQACRKVREFGRQHGLEDFASNDFRLGEEIDRPTGHTLAMVAVCLAGASCYYRGGHDKGAVYFLLSDPRIDARPGFDREGLTRAFNELMWLPGDMKTRILSYLSAKGCIDEGFTGNEVTCELQTGEQVSFAFRATEGGGTEITFSPSAG